MGTKRPSCSLFDTLSNINTSDRRLQPGGRISRDPSPRPARTAQSDRDRDGHREEGRRREEDMEKIRDKAKYKDTDPRDRYYERVPAPRTREGERERRERERRQEDDRSRNGRPFSNVETDPEREVARGAKKGDTFPRMRKGSTERARRMTPTSEIGEEKGDSRQRDRPRQMETDDRERERVRTWQRERYRERERDDIRSRAKDEGNKSGGRPVEDEKARQRERYREFEDGFQGRGREGDDSWDRRERDAGRKREKPRPNRAEREGKMYSPHRRRDRELHSNRKEREESRRDTRSEGDSDERELKRERMRDRERDELTYQHSKSEGDNKGNRETEPAPNRPQGHRGEDRQRCRDREREGDRSGKRGAEGDGERYGEVDRRAPREGGRAWSNERRGGDRHRGHEQRRDRPRKDRENHPRWDHTGSRPQNNKAAPRVPPRTQSSGEWSSDMDGEGRYRRGRGGYEERESGRESTAESERDAEERSDAERAAERRQTERAETERGDRAGGVPEQRRMWLEPRRGKNSEDESLDRGRHTGRKERRREEEEEERSVVSQAERAREAQQVKEEAGEARSDRGGRGPREEREREGVSVDGEDVQEFWRATDKGGEECLSDSSSGSGGGIERGNTTDYTEESEGEGEGGRDSSARSTDGGGGGGSESGRRQERDSMLSGEDGFVTLSSGGDEEEEEEREEFEDCREFWEGGVRHGGSSPVGDQERREEDEGRETQAKLVFCVIGQTLPRSKAGDQSPPRGVEREDPKVEKSRRPGDEATRLGDELAALDDQETPGGSEQPTEESANAGVEMRHRSSSEAGDGSRGKVENPYEEIKQIKRDSQTERLLVQWRDKTKPEREDNSPPPMNPYELNFEQIQPLLQGINAGAMSPEEAEAIRIRLSGAWSMSEEPKRHSQAPHLKWAKNVVREILGRSEEQVADGPGSPEARGGERAARPGETAVRQDEEVPRVHRTTADEARGPAEPRDAEGPRGTEQGPAHMHAEQFTATHGDTPTPAHTHADTQLDAERKEDATVVKETQPAGPRQPGKKADVEVAVSQEAGHEVALVEGEQGGRRDSEDERYLSVSNALYKPNSCPILNFESASDLLVPSGEGETQEDEDEEDDRTGESDEERQEGEPEEGGSAAEGGRRTSVGEEMEVGSSGGEAAAAAAKKPALAATCSFRDLGPEARMRRRGIRKTTERRKEKKIVEEEEEEEEEGEEEGAGRDRRTRIFATTDDEDDKSKSWGEVELRSVLETIDRRKRNSRFFNAAQLYQQYSEAAQNFEILRQTRSDAQSVGEDPGRSPAPSPPPARRPLPPLPPVPHPHSLSHTGSLTSVKSLPLPETHRSEGRPTSPRLSLSITQTSTLWRDLPGVRSSGELEELSEDQRRLQEVRFEVVTSEASYCRSLDIVVEHFVKCKQLGALLTTQDRNWLFSRLADVRAISHSFLSKLEERMEEEIVHFSVCDIIARHCQRFKMVYVPYLTNQSYQDATYQRLMNENQGFKRIVEKLERSPVCQRLPLRSFLVLPFQRITRIKLLVQNIVKRTTPGTVEATQAIKALRLLEKLIQESNDSISQMESIESLVSLSAKVDFECRTLPLISQSRRMVREGPVTELIDFCLKDTERNVYMHLFNDYLLLSLQKEGGRFSVIDHSPVSELRVENCRVKLHSLQKNLFRLHMSGKSLLLRTDTLSDKLRWISALSPPHPEIDFSAAQDFTQMQCIRAFVGKQPDELSLEKADIILVHQQSSDHWVEVTRLSDRHHGWVPESHFEIISNSRVRQRNLSDALKLTTATAAV